MKITAKTGLLILLLVPLFALAQGEHLILSNFFAEQRNETVYLQWTIKKGQTCNDIHIERSASEKNFSRIGLISGVCGSADYAVVYSYTDSLPHPNQINYYRLELGTQGYTKEVAVQTFITGKDQYVLLGNPTHNTLKIVFNDAQQRTLRIFNLHGHEVKQHSQKTKQVELDINHLNTGIYVFTAEDESGKIIHGKFVVSN